MLQIGHKRECSGDFAVRQRSAHFIILFRGGFSDTTTDMIYCEKIKGLGSVLLAAKIVKAKVSKGMRRRARLCQFGYQSHQSEVFLIHIVPSMRARRGTGPNTADDSY